MPEKKTPILSERSGLTIGLLVLIITSLTAAILWGASVQSDVAVNTSEIKNIKESVVRIEQSVGRIDDFVRNQTKPCNPSK